MEFGGLKNPTKCNSIFVYWLFLFWDRLLKLNELKGKLRVPGHLLKGKKVLQCVIITRGENNLFPGFVRGHSNLDWAVIIYNSSKKLIAGSLCSKHNITTFFFLFWTINIRMNRLPPGDWTEASCLQVSDFVIWNNSKLKHGFSNLEKRNLWKSCVVVLFFFFKKKGSQGNNLKIVPRHMRVVPWG